MSGYFAWEWAEKDPWNPEDENHEWRCVPHLTPTLGPAIDGTGGSPGSGMNLDGTMSCALAMDWDTPPPPFACRSVPEHKQVATQIDGSQVLVDEALADLIPVLNAAGARTIASCQGGKQFPPYLMFDSPGSGAQFLRVWRNHVATPSLPTPVLQFELRDDAWMSQMSSSYPFPAPVPIDRYGFGYTATWVPTRETLQKALASLLSVTSLE